MGICTQCKTPALPGAVFCEHHRDKSRKRESAVSKARRAVGKCSNCNTPAAHGHTMCDKHIESCRATGRRSLYRKSLGDRAGYLVSHTKSKAKRLGIPFSLDESRIRDVIEAGFCQVTGIPFSKRPVGSEDGQKTGRNRDPWAPSLDRIVPELGYTDKNTRVVVWMYNMAKCSYSDADVLTMAMALVERAPNCEAGNAWTS